MKDFDFDRLIDRTGTQSIKWDHYSPNVLPLWVADMDFQSPPEVIQSLVDRVKHGVFGYTSPSPEFREILKARMAQRYGWEIDTESFVFMPGVVSGLNIFCHTFAYERRRVTVQTPVYPPILHAPEYSNLQRIDLPLFQSKTGRYEIDFDGFEDGVKGEQSMFILCNPHNPTGRVFTTTELERIAEICLRHEILICSDEIHSDLIYSSHQHTPIASLSKEIEKNVITFIAPSKTYNVAGLNCAVAIIPNPSLREQFTRQKEAFAGHVNGLGSLAGLSAYRDGGEWLESLLQYLENNRDLVSTIVQEKFCRVSMDSPEGTYLAWLDCRQLGFNEDPCEFFLREAKVGLNNGADFGEPGKGFVRLNFGCPKSILLEALERMERAILKFNSKVK